MYTYLTPDPIVLEIRNASGDVRVELTDTTTTTVEIAATAGHPFGFIDDMLRSVGAGRGRRGRGFGPDRGFADGEDDGEGGSMTAMADDPTDRVRVDLREAREAGAGPTLIVDTDQARGGWRTAFDVHVIAPAGSGLRVNTQSADVSATGEADRLEVRTASGDVAVDRVRGRAVVQTASGDVSIVSAGSTEIRTASGEVNLRGTTAEAILHTTSGDIEVDRPGGDLSARSVSGEIRLRDLVVGRIEAISVSGDVEIGIHPGSLAAIDLTTVSGQTRTDMPVSDEAPAAGGADGAAQGAPDGAAAAAGAADRGAESADDGDDVGAGGAVGPALDVRVKTTSGDIRVRRATTV